MKIFEKSLEEFNILQNTHVWKMIPFSIESDIIQCHKCIKFCTNNIGFKRYLQTVTNRKIVTTLTNF